MFKTIEAHVRKQVAPAALRAEFRQHEFEAMRPFCLLVFCVSILIWLVFDLIVSFLGGQGFTWLSYLFITLLGSLTVVLRFTRRSHHFDVLNLLFIAAITLAAVAASSLSAPVAGYKLTITEASGAVLSASAPVDSTAISIADVPAGTGLGSSSSPKLS